MNACHICAKTYQRPEHLRRHLQSHNNERPFICANCNSNFQRSDTLRRHQRTCIDLTEVERSEPPAKKPALESQVFVAHQSQTLEEWQDLRIGEPDNLLPALPFDHITGWLSNAASPSRNDGWQEFLNFPYGDNHSEFNNVDTYGDRPNLGFLDNFTSRTGLVGSFDCGTLDEREAVAAHCEAKDKGHLKDPDINEPDFGLPAWIADPLALKTHEILASVAQATQNKSKRSAITFEWSPAMQQACARFFSPACIRRYVGYYWALWHPNVNIMHKPSFELMSCRPYLVATMCIIGAYVSPDASDAVAAKMWLDAVEEIVFTSDDLCDYDDPTVSRLTGRPSCRREKLRALQAAYMVLLYQTWEGSDTSKRRVRRLRFSQVVAAVRDAALPNSVHRSYRGLKLHEFSFADFANTEELVRVSMWVFLIDTAYTLFNNSPPRMVISEMTLSPACPEACFQAETAEKCLEALQAQYSSPEQSRGALLHLNSAFDMLYRKSLTRLDMDSLANLGPLNLFAMTSTLHALIFHFKSSLSCRGSLDEMKRCLTNWDAVWHIYTEKYAADPRHSPLTTSSAPCAPEDMWKRVGFMRHAGEYWLLAKLMIEQLAVLRRTRQSEDDAGGPIDLGHDKSFDCADSTLSETFLDKYDETSMQQVNDLIAMLQKTNI